MQLDSFDDTNLSDLLSDISSQTIEALLSSSQSLETPVTHTVSLEELLNSGDSELALEEIEQESPWELLTGPIALSPLSSLPERGRPRASVATTSAHWEGPADAEVLYNSQERHPTSYIVCTTCHLLFLG